jgi:hypothetical protein
MSGSAVQHTVRFVLPDGLETGVYSNYVGVEAGVHDYVLTFYQVMAPVPGHQEPVEARAVCRVTLSATLMQPLITALEGAKSNREKLVQTLPAAPEEA